MKRIFNYINDLGYHKRLEVEDIPEDDKLHCLLFGNGELCGEGMLYRTEINQMLEHYGAKGGFDPLAPANLVLTNQLLCAIITVSKGGRADESTAPLSQNTYRRCYMCRQYATAPLLTPLTVDIAL